MRIFGIVIGFFLLCGFFLFASAMYKDFLTEQMKFERVRTAVKDKQEIIEKLLREHEIATDNVHLLLVVTKDNDCIDVYAKTKTQTSYQKIHSYKICSRSGHLGPKRKQGDGQVPEGFYYIDRFNPVSNFYLSMGINYPNQSDKRKSSYRDPGGDIFIHGSCVTIGCLPITDDSIKELYLLAVYAKNNGQDRIPVYIFPFRMTDQQILNYYAEYKGNDALLSFWKNLKTGFDLFMKEQKELNIKVNANGDYSYH